MRITADLIQSSRAFYNPLRERELDLRANKLVLIENLGATKDQFDTINFSDNEIRKLENFPALRRLRSLLLNNNYVSRIAPNLGEQLVALETLILTNNLVSHFADIDALTTIRRLETLSLLDNPVTRKQHYRLYVIHKLPTLKSLDFRKIKRKEREAAAALFASAEGLEFAQAAATEKRTFVPGEIGEGEALTSAQREAIATTIKSAKTAEEIDRLERQLAAGIMPAAAAVPHAPAAQAAPAAEVPIEAGAGAGAGPSSADAAVEHDSME